MKSYVGMNRCWFCLEYKDILLDRRLKNSLPQDCGITDFEPCSKCKDYMVLGVIVITYDESKTDFEDLIVLPENNKTSMPNFHRSGGWFVVKDEAIERWRQVTDSPKIIDAAVKHRFLFIPDQLTELLGLPKLPKPPMGEPNGSGKHFGTNP
jgi:hypothetical protein